MQSKTTSTSAPNIPTFSNMKNDSTIQKETHYAERNILSFDSLAIQADSNKEFKTNAKKYLLLLLINLNL